MSGLIGVGLPLINGISYRHNRHDTPSISGQPACSVMCFSSPGGTFGCIGTLRSCRCCLRLQRFIILNQSSCARSDTDVTAAARSSAGESPKKSKQVIKRSPRTNSLRHPRCQVIRHFSGKKGIRLKVVQIGAAQHLSVGFPGSLKNLTALPDFCF